MAFSVGGRIHYVQSENYFMRHTIFMRGLRDPRTAPQWQTRVWGWRALTWKEVLWVHCNERVRVYWYLGWDRDIGVIVSLHPTPGQVTGQQIPITKTASNVNYMLSSLAVSNPTCPNPTNKDTTNSSQFQQSRKKERVSDTVNPKRIILFLKWEMFWLTFLRSLRHVDCDCVLAPVMTDCSMGRHLAPPSQVAPRVTPI